MNMPTEPNDSPHLQRRHLLQSLGVTGMTAVAGCLGRDSSESEQGAQEQDPEPETQEEEQEPEDYETPESEHLDTEELVEGWGTVFTGHNRVLIDSFSPSQISEKYNTTWIEGNSASEKYSPLPFSPEDVPETMIQETPDEANHNVVKIDQLPSGASENDVKESIQDDGYSKQSELGGFSIYTVPDEREARAVGQGRHIITFKKFSGAGTSTNAHLSYLRDVINDHNENTQQLSDGIQDLIDFLELQDSLIVVEDNTEFVGSLDDENQPQAGAVTVNFDEEIKYGAWEFEDESAAETAYEIMSGRHGELSNEFTQIDIQGKFINAQGGYELGQNFDAAYTSDYPLI